MRLNFIYQFAYALHFVCVSVSVSLLENDMKKHKKNKNTCVCSLCLCVCTSILLVFSSYLFLVLSRRSSLNLTDQTDYLHGDSQTSWLHFNLHIQLTVNNILRNGDSP